MFCDHMFLVDMWTFFYSWNRAAPKLLNGFSFFFTIYTSYDVFPRKDVPFGVPLLPVPI